MFATATTIRLSTSTARGSSNCSGHELHRRRRPTKGRLARPGEIATVVAQLAYAVGPQWPALWTALKFPGDAPPRSAAHPARVDGYGWAEPVKLGETLRVRIY